jgi:hypothetical protein
VRLDQAYPKPAMCSHSISPIYERSQTALSMMGLLMAEKENASQRFISGMRESNTDYLSLMPL